MNIRAVLFGIAMLLFFNALSQEVINEEVFNNQPINFKGVKGKDTEAKSLMDGRIVYKKVSIPKFPNGTDAKIKLTLRSNGDRWDKSGSCFVVSNPEQISILDIANGEKEFPKDSYVNEKHGGYVSGNDYEPVVELLRFMTPFGVGHYSDNSVKYRKPVYIPSWEKQVVWERDISELADLVTGEFYIGVWVDSWTAEGYNIDLELSYSNRSRKTLKVESLVNTIPYVGGQSLPDNFAHGVLEHDIELKNNIKNAKLHYVVTGHGGHSGGDEFIKIKNSIYFNNELVLDTIPWRDDCASFRRFNPTSGVWIKKDSAAYYDYKTKERKIKEIEERIASSDLSRSNWCPGSMVHPIVVELGDLKSGIHNLKIKIPATPVDGDKLNHWLVSAYLTYEND